MGRFLILFLLIVLSFPATGQAEDKVSWWRPNASVRNWDILLQDPPHIDTLPARDMLILDLFDTPVETVVALQKQGTWVVCYINVGAWENWRPDAKDFPTKLIGKRYRGWQGEKWLDIRNRGLRPLIEARLDLCRDKGFDGVDPDNINGFENTTGFSINDTNQMNFNRWLARAAHSRGLGIGLKNATSLSANLVADFDWVLMERCVLEGWCAQAEPFQKAGKMVFDIEYPENNITLAIGMMCKQKPENVNVIFKDRQLTSVLHTCP
ncbi:endo alpha-1,4 polygalactosaminidase [Micavibrio aeruginosavorus]|uniref:endo alpha-1,4 polygalactosaminidase n=1 Tax=Micavibrio aeruginosavorus TaxID=349221 RepID=UPI003F4ADCC1